MRIPLKNFESSIQIENLMADARLLEYFAFSTQEKNRVFGSPGHQKTVNWLYYEFLSLREAFTVTLQPFVEQFSGGYASLIVDDNEVQSDFFSYSPSGTVRNVPVIPIPGVGCTGTEYPPSVQGSIALVARGECEFGKKSSVAGSAGAVAVIIFNNQSGNLSGTLGNSSRSQGPFLPTVAIPQLVGQNLLSLITSGSQPVLASLDVKAVTERRTTYNVIADSTFGNKSSIIAIGAHSDSVEAGPGINDNGSGVVGILAVARALASFSSSITSSMNAVRFAFWSAEESGLLGSKHYVKSLPESELRKIKTYINCDMIASPNSVYGLLDGDRSKPFRSPNGTRIPSGSSYIELLFARYFASQQLNVTDFPFAGNSDYGPFADRGIPAGGIATGAGELKTSEEVSQFGGTAGIAYDPNYHGADDTVANLNKDTFLVTTRSVARVVSSLVGSLGDIPDWSTAFSREGKGVSGRGRRKVLGHSKALPTSRLGCGGQPRRGLVAY